MFGVACVNWILWWCCEEPTRSQQCGKQRCAVITAAGVWQEPPGAFQLCYWLTLREFYWVTYNFYTWRKKLIVYYICKEVRSLQWNLSGLERNILLLPLCRANSVLPEALSKWENCQAINVAVRIEREREGRVWKSECLVRNIGNAVDCYVNIFWADTGSSF